MGPMYEPGQYIRLEVGELLCGLRRAQVPQIVHHGQRQPTPFDFILSEHSSFRW
jgi:hypothetical protein